MLITIPSFYSIDTESFDLLLKFLPSFRSNYIVIFDMRGNAGGNSDYGNKIFQALAYYSNLLNQNFEVHWRISQANLNHIKVFPIFNMIPAKQAKKYRYI